MPSFASRGPAAAGGGAAAASMAGARCGRERMVHGAVCRPLGMLDFVFMSPLRADICALRFYLAHVVLFCVSDFPRQRDRVLLLFLLFFCFLFSISSVCIPLFCVPCSQLCSCWGSEFAAAACCFRFRLHPHYYHPFVRFPSSSASVSSSFSTTIFSSSPSSYCSPPFFSSFFTSFSFLSSFSFVVLG